ncbi:MAG: aerotolerance regulator BatA [Candidatus Wallbacteria bacterium HGW-Wallbacteria-1]|jgi:Ca-activated chloride channel family protein|uniref:Aerotolerance regulator BatA n=1 Tax=Candidatus Wallbacteria bacterium HGW-Wallbacteria-1 TaxID=2013854 RepID=A0A2N1PLH2_9BACT|nr:MAG: aerotolerance regulator BatA [Candidatus Wallbacteria bacterium HGW-Wallbacteria-1]
MSFRFDDPLFLLLIPIFVFFFRNVFFRGGGAKSPAILFSDVRNLKLLQGTMNVRMRRYLPWFRMFLVVLLITALARPQYGRSEDQILTEGVDIILALDISGSMAAEDLANQKTRLDVAREVIDEFITNRKNDRIGLVLFSSEAFTQCPLTLDYNVLKKFVEGAKMGLIKDGTAIGSAIACSVARLRESKAKSKIIILLTDGQNNAGQVDPVTAAKMATALGIRVYTIGAGTRGLAPMAVDDPIFGRRYVRVKVDIDEELLTGIANDTGGTYFRATDARSLMETYQKIDEMEKTEVKVRNYTHYREVGPVMAGIGFLLLIFELILDKVILRRLP